MSDVMTLFFGDDVVYKVEEDEVKDISGSILKGVEVYGPPHQRREGLCQNVRWHGLQRVQMLGAKFEIEIIIVVS